MKVAVVHEMLIKLWWAENVVLDILDIFPEADLFTLIYDEKKVWRLFPKSRIKHVPKTTQRVYNITKNQRFCLPFMAKAVESLDLSDYDLVIASSSWFAHWCITKPETCFIVYYHSPARYLWDWTFEHRKDMNYKKLFKVPLLLFLSVVFHKLRIWDYQAWQRHDIAIAASKQVLWRIKKYYKRDAQVIYPAVWTEKFEIWEAPLKDRQYYVITSALTEFKKVDIAVKAFNEILLPLKIIWDWDQLEPLRNMASPNIEFLWRKWHDEIREIYKNARWFIMCWRDDFWIAPIEAMSAWIPVFALNQWGLTETNIEYLTWEFFDDPSWSDFIKKFLEFNENIEQWKYDRIKINMHAKKFNKERFEKEFSDMINSSLS